MKDKLLLLFLGSLFLCPQTFSQVFEEVTSHGLPALSQGDMEWGDYDQDGDLDVLCMGYNNSSNSQAVVYRNNGNNTFTHVASLTGLYYGCSIWGDYNNDGYLDILISGRNSTGTPNTLLYRNNSGGSFSRQYGSTLRALSYSAGDWGDYDNDGDLDFLLSGEDAGGIRYSVIYRNNGNNTFTEMTGISLMGLSRGSVDWIDVNSDGLLDIFLTGYDQANTSQYAMYENEGDGSFTQVTGLPFTGVHYSDACWGNYDHDHDLDLLLIGYSTQLGGPVVKLYKKGYGFSFTEETVTGLTPAYVGEADWGDCDNDGDLDVIVSGYNSGASTQLFRNDGNNTFVEYTGISTLDAYYSSVQWGDFDGDRDLDVYISGINGPKVNQLLRNLSSTPNTAPEAPDNLSFEMDFEGLHFDWDSPTDNETNSYALSYNMRIGTTPGGSEVMSAHADPATGKLYLPDFGSKWMREYFTLSDLPGGTYYWSVQAVDHGYLASPFAEEQTFELTFILAPYEFEIAGVPCLGDYDGDQDLDILMGNFDGTTIYRNDLSTGGGFTDIVAGLPQTYGMDSDYAWGDYDNDGDLDIAYCGYWGEFWTRVYRNDNGVFTDIEAGMEGVWMGALSWIDFDNDGDLDLVCYGNHESSDDGEPLGRLYRNDGNDVFTDTELDVEAARRGDVGVADFNKDGYQDILTCGYNLSQNIFTSLLRNDAGISFTNMEAGINAGSYGALAWGDYDNDGDQDFYFSGGLYGGGGVSRIFQNQGDETFVDIGVDVSGGGSSYSGSAQWGDFDNDGDLDLLASGATGINVNEGGGQFSFLELHMPVGGTWGDMDNDGDLDMVSGSAIYLNELQVGNNPPGRPGNLHVEIAGNQATLMWDPPTDDHTPSEGLTYNVRVGTTADIGDVLSANNGDNHAYRGIPSQGNAGSNTFKIIRDLPQGTYQWTVQAIDPSYAASPFTGEHTFEIFPMFSSLDLYDREDIGYVDYDNDGVVEIEQIDNGSLSLYSFEGGDSLQLIVSGVPDGDWFDYDGDGDLDRVGESAVYRNDLDGNFVNTGNSGSGIPAGRPGDYDGDGDIDYLMVDSDTILRNNGGLQFTKIGLGLGFGNRTAYYWFDYDNDSDLDICVLNGTYFNTDPIHIYIFRNEGAGQYTDIGIRLPGVDHDYGVLSFADYNSDGLMDIFAGGTDENNNNLSIIYQNNGDDSFSRIQGNIRGFSGSFGVLPYVQWGDYNFDGLLDVVISGWNNGRERNKLYQNNGDETFTELGMDDIVEYMHIKYSGDYDGDGDLDKITDEGVFRNNTNQNYPEPGIVSGLSSDLKGLDVLLSWDRSGDPRGAGYSYNVRIGTTPGGYEIKGPNISKPTFGNVPCDTSFRIRDLEPGTYYWSIQAVNQVYDRGSWTSEQTFVMTRVSPEFNYDTVCHGYPTTFTDLSVTTDEIERWYWDFGDGSTSAEQFPSYIYPEAGSYEVMLRAYTLSGDSADRVHTVIVMPSPDASFSVDAVCKDQPSLLDDHTVLNGTTVASWNWDFGNGESSDVQGSVEKTYVNSATAILNVVAENACWDADTQRVVVIPYADATVSLVPGYNTRICDGDTSLMVVAKQYGYDYQWKLNDGNLLGATDTFLYVTEGAGMYTVDLTSRVASCTSTDGMEIRIDPVPGSPSIAWSEDPAALCKGEALTLSIPDIAGYTYNWQRDGGPQGVNANEIQPTESGLYTVIITNAENCSAEASNPVNVNFLDLPLPPSISIQGNTNFCSGESVKLSVSATTGLNYQWSRDGQLLSGENKDSLVATEAGSYEIDVTDGNGCSSPGTEAVQVIVRTTPAAPDISVTGNPTLCEDETLSLSVPYLAGYSYAWTRDEGVTGGVESTFQPEEGGSYGVTMTNEENCSVNALHEIQVNFLDKPDSPTIIVGETTICQGELVEMRMTAVEGLTYAWFRDGGLQQEGSQNTFSAGISGNYSLMVSNAAGCSSMGTESVDVEVLTVPELPVISVEGSTTLCEGESVGLSVPYTQGYSYAWTRNDGYTTSDTTFINPVENGSFNVTVSIEGNCPRTAESPVLINFIASPVIPVISWVGDTSLCTGDELTLSIPDNIGYSYDWSRDGGSMGVNAHEIYPLESGSYQVVVSNANNCSTTSQNVVDVQVHNNPPLTNIQFDGPLTFCGTEGVTLSVQQWPGHDYNWTRDQAPVPINSHEVYVSSSGTYSLTLVNEHGCETAASDAVDVLGLPFPAKPSITGTADTSFCKGELISLSFDNIGEGEYCKWKRNGIDFATSVDEIQVSENGEYSLEIVNDIGCTSPPSNSRSFTFYDTPAKPLLSIGEDNIVELCPGDQYIIDITNASMVYDYSWSRNGNDFTPADQRKLSGVLDEGNYKVSAGIGECASDSARFQVSYNSAPEKPGIVVGGGPSVYYLFSDVEDADHYQWYYEGAAIGGANEYYYVANQELGTYQLEIAMDNMECSIRADEVQVPGGATGIDELKDGQLHVYPNPSSGEFALEFRSSFMGELWLKVVSMSGKTLLHQELFKEGLLLEEMISLNLDPGIYILEIIGNEGTWYERILIN